MVDLDEKDLLQANATIIAGVLILLSLVGSVSDSGLLQIQTRIVMGFAIMPFIISSILLFITHHDDHSEIPSEKRFSRAKYTSVAGLIYLGGAVIALLASLK